MQFSITLLCLAIIFSLLLVTGESAMTRRNRKGRLSVERRKQPVRATWQMRRTGRKLRRKGRQEDEDIPAADEGVEVHNGCDYTTNIGAFLNFLKFRKFCVEKGVTDFGPYGGVPAEQRSAEEQEDDVVVVDVA